MHCRSLPHWPEIGLMHLILVLGYDSSALLVARLSTSQDGSTARLVPRKSGLKI
jgi:hypothetical protein